MEGVFDLINQVDRFVFHDDLQFTKQDWRTRNYIKTSNGPFMLSIPVKKMPYDTNICNIEISKEVDWQTKHFRIIKQNYSKSKYFNDYYDLLEDIYLKNKWSNLSEFNIFTTKLIANKLNIDTEFFNSIDLKVSGSKTPRLIEILKKLDGNEYLSGAAAKSYIEDDLFKKNNISLKYIIYDYPEYTQLYPPFDHHITVLDVLFNCGPKSKEKIFLNKFETVKL